MKKLFLLLALLGMVAVGCSKDDTDKGNDNKTEQPNENEGGSEDNIPENIFFGLDKESVTISPDGGSVDVIVYSNYKWEISGTSDWCTPSVKGGDANENGQKVSFSADVAYDDREATFWFRCADKQIKFVVSQKLKEVIIPDANNTFNIPAKGGVAVISYQTNIDCEVIIPEEVQDWITIAPASRGLSTYSTTLNIAENNSDKERSCVIKVTSQGNKELSAEYNIAQNPRCFLYYTSNDGKIVTPYNSSAFDATIVSNTYIDGVGVIEFDAPITTIGNSAFWYCDSLTSVTIPDSVTTIGNSAFEYCSRLTSVTIPDSVTTIGYEAFAWCCILTSVTIGDSVTTIGDYAFSDCFSLTSVTIPDSVTEIGDSAFEYCSRLTSVTIGDSVTTIGKWAFRNCDSLTSVTIPNSVTTIGDRAFAVCSSLQDFNGKFASEDGRCLIIDGVLNSFAPAGLTEYNIPDSVTTIGDSAFYSCESLTSVTIPDSVTTIGDYAFYKCSSLTSVTIGDSVTEIGDYAFYVCSSLTSVTIGDSVTTIGEWAFAYCDSLTSVTIPDSVTTIGKDAFGYCKSLTSVTIGDSVTSIGDWAFAYCDSLTSVTIGDSVTTIGYEAFYNCSSLTSVYCKPTTPPTTIVDYNGYWCAFDENASGRKIYVPMESVEAYKSASYWSSYADDIVGYYF